MTLLATQITDALVARMATVTAINGYPSEIGRTVFSGTLKGDAVQAPCVFVTPGRTTDTAAYSGILESTRTYDLVGYCDSTSYPDMSDHAIVDAIAWDIRRALAATDPALAALVRQIRFISDSPGYREDGGNLVGASVVIEIDYAVALTDPSTPV